jgi:hypothetical protein
MFIADHVWFTHRGLEPLQDCAHAGHTQDHWTERGRATAVANSDATDRPRRSVLSLGKRHIMKATLLLLFFGLVSFLANAQESKFATNRLEAASPDWYKLTGPQVQVICKPDYYRRAADGFLIPVQSARLMKSLTVDGIVLTVVKPEHLEGQVIAFHFDFPEDWDHWYKPDVLYTGVTTTNNIGVFGFRCDPGWHPASTNAPPGVPNQHGAANGSQPLRAETNRTSSAAGSRR